MEDAAVPRHRDHNRPKTMDESKAALTDMARAAEKTMLRKMATFPEGEGVSILKTVTRNMRRGDVSEMYKVIGTEKLKRVVLSLLPTIQEKLLEDSEDEEEDTGESYEDLLIMPANAEIRATKVREMVHRLWSLEKADTPYATSKHIYKIVKRGLDPGFSWWHDALPGIPFTNKAMEGSRASKTVFSVVAPKVYHLLTGEHGYVVAHEDDHDKEEEVEPAPLEEPPPVIQCTRSELCSRPNQHRGRCNREYEVRHTVIPTDPLDLDAYLDRIRADVHAADPFVKGMSAGKLAVFVERMKRGDARLDAYRAAGSLSKEYVLWYTQQGGAGIWETIDREFPGALYALDTGGGDLGHHRPVVDKKKEKKKKKKIHKKLDTKARQRKALSKTRRRTSARYFVH